jgi:peptide/nickel transport system substrate-binding protein
MVLSKTNEKILKIAVVVVFAIFAVQILAIMPSVLFRASGQYSSGSGLNSITLTDYNGNDQSGVADLAAGKVAAYDFQLTPTELAQLNSSFSKIVTPSALYDILLNPVNTSWGFNPFQFQTVRQAVNYVLDRNYFIDNLLGGNAIPAISPYAGEPDALVVSNTTAEYTAFLQYNLALANQSIYQTLVSAGATYGPSSGGNSSWSYNSQPITLNLIQRTDDPIRDEYAGFLASQFEDLGFKINIIQATLAKANSMVYGSDPYNSTWSVYTESWGGVYQYYDESLVSSFAGTLGGVTPFSDAIGDAMGAYNDSAHEAPSLIQQGNQIDSVALQLFEGQFNSFSQRSQLLNNITNLSFQSAVRIYVATSLNAYAFNPAQLSKVTPNFLEDPILNTNSYMTMASATGSSSVNIGVRYLEQGALNPIGGWKDSYSVAGSAGVVLPSLYYQPSTAYPYGIGFTYKLDSISPTANDTLPSSALYYNYTTGDFDHVANGTQAKTAVTVNFAPLLSSEKWSDGQPITMADLIYQYVIYENASMNANSSIYDGYANEIYSSSLDTITGFQLLNSTSMIEYSSYYYPDPTYAALDVATLLLQPGDALPGGDMLPWQLYQAMANVVSEGKAAWSTSAATSKSIDWLSLVSPTDVSAITSQLSTLSLSSYVPPELTQLASITGVNMTTPSQAQAGYSAITSFINKYGNAVISDGPFIITQYQTTTTPNFEILTKNPLFNSSIYPEALLTPATSITSTAIVPAFLTPGSSFNVTTLSTLLGTNDTQPLSGVKVVAQIVANGSIVSQTSTISGMDGQATISLPSNLPSGTYTLLVYSSNANSSLINPLQTSITVIAGTNSTTSTTTNSSTIISTPTAVTTTTTSSPGMTSSASSSSSSAPPITISSTSTSSSTSTTSSSTSTLEIAAVVVVVVIIAVGIIAMRRRGTPSSAPPAST